MSLKMSLRWDGESDPGGLVDLCLWELDLTMLREDIKGYKKKQAQAIEDRDDLQEALMRDLLDIMLEREITTMECMRHFIPYPKFRTARYQDNLRKR